MRDVSYPGVVRKLIDMQYYRDLSDDELIAYSLLAIKWASRYGPSCAYSISFWRDAKKIGKEAADATVEYAPNGVWADAHLVKAGDYHVHQMKVVANNMGEKEASRPAQ
jgi:hypothetical protein